jgi:hypothetical protein
MLAKQFPHYHPRKGEPTNFKQLYLDGVKITTIREGEGYKVGETRSVRQWLGRPYHSGHDIVGDAKVVKVLEIKIDSKANVWVADALRTSVWYGLGSLKQFVQISRNFDIEEMAKNDGLSLEDLYYLFAPAIKKGGFKGQIVYLQKQ